MPRSVPVNYWDLMLDSQGNAEFKSKTRNPIAIALSLGLEDSLEKEASRRLFFFHCWGQEKKRKGRPSSSASPTFSQCLCFPKL